MKVKSINALMQNSLSVAKMKNVKGGGSWGVTKPVVIRPGSRVTTANISIDLFGLGGS